MSGWALETLGFTETDLMDFATSNTYKTLVTAHATINTKGSWVEIVASTSQDANSLSIQTSDSRESSFATGFLLDIGVGGSGSEVVVIANICAGAHGGDTAFISLSIPAGTRISARCQAVITEDTVNVGIGLLGIPNGFNSDGRKFGNVVTYGAVTATSYGTYVTASGVANSFGSWTEITPSTTEPHSAIGISVQGTVDSGMSTAEGLLQIAAGAGGSEEVLFTTVRVITTVGEITSLADDDFHALSIGRTLPVGTRLSARYQFDQTSNDDLSLCLHGAT